MQRQILDLLESWLRHKSDMVNFEAARVICEFQSKSSSSTLLPVLTKAVSVLQLFLSSPKPVQKFAAIRTLSALAAVYPNAVAACNLDMENLITDSNRSIATYAITTLLKVHIHFPSASQKITTELLSRLETKPRSIAS